MKALELYLEQDFEEEMNQWHKQTDYVVKELSGIPGLTVQKGLGESPGIQPECIPRAYITWDEAKLGLTKDELVELLKTGEPGIAVSTFPLRGIDVNPHMLNPGEEVIVVNRIKEIFSQKGVF